MKSCKAKNIAKHDIELKYKLNSKFTKKLVPTGPSEWGIGQAPYILPLGSIDAKCIKYLEKFSVDVKTLYFQ